MFAKMSSQVKAYFFTAADKFQAVIYCAFVRIGPGVYNIVVVLPLSSCCGGG